MLYYIYQQLQHSIYEKTKKKTVSYGLICFDEGKLEAFNSLQ